VDHTSAWEKQKLAERFPPGMDETPIEKVMG
jgi:hypothetical protein